MTIWNVVNGTLFVGALLAHIAKFGKMDFAEGDKQIRQFDDAAMGGSILSAVAVALSCTQTLAAYRQDLTITAFSLLFLSLGFRYQVGKIFQRREEDKVAEAMAKYLDEVTAGVRRFTAGLLKMSDPKDG